jgi:membrane protease YdiL (CAAX protease family)
MNNEKSVSQKKINWFELLIFYAVAVLVSAPFRLSLIDLSKIAPLPCGFDIFYHILRGIGPAVGFIVVFYFLKSKDERKFSFWGLSKLYTLLAAAVIPIGLVIIGVQNKSGVNEHYYGLLSGIMLILYAIGEEYGWRGYLQQALAPLKEPWRILAIAVLWYMWHLNFLLPDFTVKAHLVFFGFLLLGSWGLMKISQSSLSILFTAGVHISFNVLSDVKTVGNKDLILLVAASVWTALIFLISRKQKSEAAKLV